MINAMLKGLAEIIDLSMQKSRRIQLKYLSKMTFFKKESLPK